MDREEIINKIEKQRGFCDIIDAFNIIGVFTDLYGVIYNDHLEVEEELIYMYDKIKNYNPVEDMLPTDPKTCIICLVTKQRMDFSLNKIAKDKKNSLCKECYNKRNRAYKRRTPEELLEIANKKKLNNELLEKGLKICTGCKETKELNEFYKNPNTKSGVGSKCKSCDIKRRNKKKRKI